MKKTHDQRYEDAVTRNLNATKTYNGQRYVGVTLANAKKMIGIKPGDTRWDAEIEEVIKG